MATNGDRARCGSMTFTGVVTFAVSIAMIAVGSYNIRYSNELNRNERLSTTCPMQPKTPVYLVVAGVLSITLLFSRLFIQSCCQHLGECGEDNKCCNCINFACSFSCLLVFDIFAFIVTIIWLIVGTVWVCSVWQGVNFDDTSVATYCPRSVYLFAFVNILLGWISLIFILTCGVLGKCCDLSYNILCCIPCKEAKVNQHQHHQHTNIYV